MGTHVALRKYSHGLDALLGLKETFKGLGEVRNQVRAAMRVSAPPSVARRLRLEPGEQAVFVERLRYLGDLPLSLDLPPRPCPMSPRRQNSRRTSCAPRTS